MSTLGSWVLSIAGVVLLGTVIDLLLTKSRLKTFIRSVFASVTVLIIVTPIPAFIQSGFKADFDWGNIELDNNYLQYTETAKLNAIARAVEAVLADDGLDGAKVTVDGEVGDEILVRNVVINLSETVIAGESEHINKYAEVRKKVAAYLRVSEDKVSVYG
ncbi:MAG: stage III sporulation protein AF [Clostridia bacterium]|nr:stage III sporulation protein AF [Clostridia bacterium]